MFFSLKKIFIWIKAYWYIPVIIFIIIFCFFAFRGKVPESLIAILNRRKKIHQEEVDIIEKAHLREIEEREKSQKIYFDTIEQIEKKYKEQKQELDNKMKKKLKKIVDETKNDPKLLADRLSQQIGFQVFTTEK